MAAKKTGIAAGKFVVLTSSCGSADQLTADDGYANKYIHATEAAAKKEADRIVDEMSCDGNPLPTVVVAKIVAVGKTSGLISWK